ncbi:PRC domain containing protein [Streptomyces sp. CB00455]|uniref:PRC-barrel domain-containing protein n=1 Tax=Streptomyces sp. CB00455 TaxID=1703927 RepID=UPI00093C61E5|nr:PRC-barrel domain-containing protein [Streptomyces sp. CB00455]OKK22115.1 PRC domain containing protein [Streptomyces sp. CB00455]
MTEHVWSYQSAAGYLAGTDLTGFTVEATDGTIGKVDKHNGEAGDAYLVVDTGVWIFGKEVLLPAGTVTRIDLTAGTIHVDRTKDQIKAAPEFHREEHLQDAGYRAEVGTYYDIGGPLGGEYGSHRA